MSLLERRAGGTPLYSQVEERLLERLRRELRPGELLPTQRELAAQFGTSLITVKRALHELGQKGYLESTRGRGTVVTRPAVADDRTAVSSWTDSMTGLGRSPRTVSSRVRLRVPPPEISRLLGLRSREKSVLLERLRTLDGQPFCLMTNELPRSLASDLPASGLPEESLYAWLRSRHHLVPHRAHEEVTARAPLPPEEAFLGPRAGIVLVVRRHTFLEGGRALEIAQMVAPASRYRYHVEVEKR